MGLSRPGKQVKEGIHVI